MWKWVLLFAVPILVLLWIALLGPRTVVLTSGGGVVARATEPAGPPWSVNRKVTIRVGGSNVFGVWKDFFASPMFIYSFPGARRFLCVYDYDVAILTFVVDLEGSRTNRANQPRWPTDDYTRQVLEQGATNVVINSSRVVRLPNYGEVQEVSTKVRAWTPQQFKAASFPLVDLGFFSFRSSDKQFVLWAIDTNRHGVWPTK